MTRRPLAIVMNEASARHLNVAYALHPCETLCKSKLANLVKRLSQSASVDGGRVDSGGLIEFEPRDVERIMVPPLSSPANYVKPSVMGYGSGARTAAP